MAQPAIFSRMDVLADRTRSRLLLVLERHEMTVSELQAALQLPQSTVSRHLKILAGEGWVTSRADGASHRYSMVTDRLEPAARELWQLVRGEFAGTRTAAHDLERVESVLKARRAASQEFFASAADRWDGLRVELFGSRPELSALPALFDTEWAVGDLGCGTGQLAETLAPFVGRILAVDDSPAMLEAARARLDRWENVEVRQGELEALPLPDGTLDVAILSLVLHYTAEPINALTEARRVLRPSGRILIVDMMPHERVEYRREMGHVWQGFSEEQMERWLTQAGFGAIRYRRLPPDLGASGPTLFGAAARIGQPAGGVCA